MGAPWRFCGLPWGALRVTAHVPLSCRLTCCLQGKSSLVRAFVSAWPTVSRTKPATTFESADTPRAGKGSRMCECVNVCVCV